jgi:SAM-dependent methyltransferase
MRQSTQRPSESPCLSSTPFSDVLGALAAAEDRVRKYTGMRLENLQILDIGAGGELRHLQRLASLRNEVVGIDTDITAARFPFGNYLHDGPAMRIVKSLQRKMIGRGTRTGATLRGEVGLDGAAPVRLLPMPATCLTFPNASFGFVCSLSAFQYIDDPWTALREVARVLRPGGVVYVRVHIYTSNSGHGHPAHLAGQNEQHPLWPHLRPAFEDTVYRDAHLNRLPLQEWRLLFTHIMPGVYLLQESDETWVVDELRRLRQQGHLTDYTDEELTTVHLVAIWKKTRGAAFRDRLG